VCRSKVKAIREFYYKTLSKAARAKIFLGGISEDRFPDIDPEESQFCTVQPSAKPFPGIPAAYSSHIYYGMEIEQRDVVILAKKESGQDFSAHCRFTTNGKKADDVKKALQGALSDILCAKHKKKLTCPARDSGCYWFRNRCQDFACSALTRFACTRTHRSFCTYAGGKCSDRAPTAFPTRRPTKNPTGFACDNAASLRTCRSFKYRKKCVWFNRDCVERTAFPTRTPTGYPTKRPTSAPTDFACDNAASLRTCRSLKYRKKCVWFNRDCVERTSFPTRSPTPFTCENFSKTKCNWKRYRSQCTYNAKTRKCEDK